MSAICGVFGVNGDFDAGRLDRSLAAMSERCAGSAEVWHGGSVHLGAAADRSNRAPLRASHGGGSRCAVVDAGCDTGLEREQIRQLSSSEAGRLVDSLAGPMATPPDFAGGFAVASWEARRDRFILARDRFGAKPLFYARRNGSLAFASELRGLLQLVDERPAINPLAVDSVLALGYVPAPWTMFTGIMQLEPGAVLALDRGGAEKRFAPRRAPDIEVPATFDDRCTLLRELLERSVAATLDKLPDCGFLLSGGVDTAVLVACAARNGHPRPRTFTLGFCDGNSIDERASARLIARRLDTDHHELEINCDCLDGLRGVTSRTGAPVGNPAALLCDTMFRQLSGQLSHAVTGDGGNEIFGATYKYNQVLGSVGGRLTSLPHRLVKSLGQAVWRQLEDTALDPLVQKLARGYFKSVQRGSAGLLAPEQNRAAAACYASQVSIWSPPNRQDLYTPEFRSSLAAFAAESLIADRFDLAESGDSVLQQLVSVRVETFIPDEIMPYVERQAQAHGVSAVFPLLEPRLVDTMRSYPYAEIFAKGWRFIMEESLADAYALRDRFEAPHKGFKPPLNDWLRTPRWREMVADYLDPAAIAARGMFSAAAVEDLRRRLDGGKKHVGRPRNGKLQPLLDSVWTMVALEDWMREFAP